MKRNKLGVVLLAAVVFMPAHAATSSCAVSSASTIVPLVELYTSEGCSSCPPADAWLSQQLFKPSSKANFLAFHVDYWDEIGWPDRFANHTYTLRQQARAQQNRSNTVYTPQVMIGQHTQVNWRANSESAGIIQRIGAQPAMANIRVQAQHTGTRWNATVQVSSKIALADARWFVATYQDGLKTHVKAGENKGLLLSHNHVVRQWLGPYALSDHNSSSKLISINLQAAEKINQTGLLVLLENTKNGEVYQSLDMPFAHCTP